MRIQVLVSVPPPQLWEDGETLEAPAGGVPTLATFILRYIHLPFEPMENH